MPDRFPLEGAQLKAGKALALAQRSFTLAQARCREAQGAVRHAQERLSLLEKKLTAAHKQGEEPQIRTGWQMGMLGAYTQRLLLEIEAQKEELTSLKEALTLATAQHAEAQRTQGEAQNRVDIYEEKRREYEVAQKRSAMDAADEEVQESYAWRDPTE